jgi:RNA polymerase sigma-70 factor (sigma-E family)
MESSDFEELCDSTYERVVKAAFLILGDRDEARDVAQETFARAFARWSRVRGMDNPEGWLYRVAVNLSLSWRERAVRRVLRQPPDRAQEQVESSDPTLTDALRRLTPAQRTAVVLRFYLDLSIDSTAETLGKSPGTVRALSSQGIARLREDLGSNWLEEDDERTLS